VTLTPPPLLVPLVMKE